MNIRTVSPVMLAMVAASAAYAVDLPVVADVHVGASTPQSGALPNLLVGGGNRALLRFDLSVLPAGLSMSQVVKATLVFHVNRIASAGSMRVAPLAGPFEEMTVTQATAPPGLGVAPVNVIPGLNLVDVTQIVQFWIGSPASAFGIEMADSGSPGLSVQIDSRENTATSFPAEIRVVLSGPAGPQGLTGLTGPTGATGATGPVNPSVQTGLCEVLTSARRPLPQGLDCPSKLVFATSSMVAGNFGGLAAADTICNNEAAAAGRVGTFKAWLSDSLQSPSMRMTQSAVPYRRSDGALVAYNWADLTDGSLHAAISLTASGVGIDHVVWTNTAANGTILSSSHCNNWTSSGGSLTGAGGAPNLTDGWSTVYNGDCRVPARLYCFQQ
ncbi:MAG: DUF1554 domain-containing protein [Bryobacteraceae bacterium]